MNQVNQWLNGKKVLISGIAASLTALGTAIGSLQDGFQVSDLHLWGTSFAIVMGIFGFGHKLQKLIDALSSLGK